MAFKSQLLFSVLENILKTKSENLMTRHIGQPDWQTVSKFMVLRYLSMSSSPDVRNVVFKNYLSFERMDLVQLYKILIKLVPQQANSFIRYIR